MIDSEGFRANVGIIITNRQGQVFWCRRFGQDSWQFPQGGINVDETPEQAMFRELYEEVGLGREDVQIMGSTRKWLHYRLPKQLIRQNSKPLCIGQKQRWFLLRLQGDVSNVRFDTYEKPEFDGWQWVNYWYPVRRVVAFKREVYRLAMKELMTFMLRDQNQRAGTRKRRRRRHQSEHKAARRQERQRG